MKIDKIVQIFPYIQIDKIIKMDDFEIYPYSEYDFSGELSVDEKSRLDGFVCSFRKTFFKKGEFPGAAKGVGILKYKGTILRTKVNSDNIHEKIKILFLLLNLHISHDFFNSGMNYINVKSFDIFGFNLDMDVAVKFGNMSDYSSIYTTIPENINGLSHVKFYPLNVCINPIPVEFRFAGGGDEIFGINPKMTDITSIYMKIISNKDYADLFQRIAQVYYGLMQQTDIFFYFSIVPTILEVILYPLPFNQKKSSALKYGKLLDEKIIGCNDLHNVVINHKNEKESIGLIARTFNSIYDIRNDFLHEGTKSYNKLTVTFRGVDLKVYDIFQLTFKYSILRNFIEKGVIPDDFSKLEFEGSMFTAGTIKIKSTKSALIMDAELDALVQKAESDKLYGN